MAFASLRVRTLARPLLALRRFASQSVEKGPHPFLVQDVLWMHNAQHRDLDFFGGMLQKAKDKFSAAATETSELQEEQKIALKALERAWYYLFQIIFAQHDDAEDKILFPSLQEADPGSENRVKHATTEHMELAKKRENIADIVKELTGNPSPSQVRELLKTLEEAVQGFASFYKHHTEEEEKIALEVVTKHVPEEQQIQLINRLNNFYTTTQEGRIHIMLVREEIRADSKKEEWYKKVLPSTVRYAMAPLISNVDPGCVEYWHLFHPETKE